MRWSPIIIVAVSILAGAVALAQEPPAAITWSGSDIAGVERAVPGDRPTAVLFIRPDQPQSRGALEQFRAVMEAAKDIAALVVISGADAELRARTAALELKLAWPVIADPDFAASGAMNVHVWPTTVVIDPAGREVGHLASLPSLYSRQLEAYLDAARGKLDAAQLNQRLQARDVVLDSPQQQAGRHLRIARALLEKGSAELARGELAKGLALDPDHAELKLAMADVQCRTGEPATALTLLDGVTAGAIPSWQISVVRGRALVSLQRHDEALPILQEAVKLNPKPAEAWYLLGLLHQQQNRWEDASNAFRKAYEYTPTGRADAASMKR